MGFGTRVRALIGRLAGRSRRERELDEELRHYLETRINRHRQAGLPAAEARRRALAEMGGLDPVKEAVRDAWIGRGIEAMATDLRYGLRSIVRAPGFAGIVVATLALGIGANVTMFSVMHAVLWRELPYPQADRLVVLDAEIRGATGAGLASAEAREFQAMPHLFDLVATIVGVDAHLTIDGEMERVAAASVTDDVLPVLGATPMALGRTLLAAVDEGPNVVVSIVISDSLWRRRFGADPAAVGRQVTVNNLNVQIVGVLQPGFRVHLPSAANTPENVDVWFPRAYGDTRRDRGPITIGRLASGVTLPVLERELQSLTDRYLAENPADYAGGTFRLRAELLRDALTKEARTGLQMLGAAVAFVLLVACVNVSNLLLARAGARTRELAVRGALGASRMRLVRQLLTEAGALASLGGIAGLAIGSFGISVVDWLRPSHLPRQSQIAIDPVVALVVIVASVAVSLIFGLLPALTATAAGQAEPLKSGRGETQRPGLRRLQRGLVVAEIALSIVPLIGAGLMLRTFANLMHAPVGFDPSNVVTARMAYSGRAFPGVDRRWPLHREAVDRLEQLPGVEDASAGSPLPFAPLQATCRYARADDPDGPRDRASIQTVMPGYFRVMRTPIRAGRDFTNEDVTARRDVVIVDEYLAKRLWRTDPIGERIVVELAEGRDISLDVIGVTAGVRTTRVRDDGMPHVFLPYHVFPIQLSAVLRTRESASALGPAIKRAVEGLGTGRPVHEIRPLQEYVDASVADTRFSMLVLAGFAGAAVLLAAVGLYGTLAYLIARRRREFGIRMALGASAGRLVRMVARESAVLTSVGAAVGLAGASAATRSIRGLLYGVTPFDGVTLVSAALLVAAFGVLAAIAPARRAARVDPTLALQAE